MKKLLILIGILMPIWAAAQEVDAVSGASNITYNSDEHYIGTPSDSITNVAQLREEILNELRAELGLSYTNAKGEKKAAKPSRLTLGGYGEAVYTRNFYSDNPSRYLYPETYKNDKSHGKVDMPHVTFFVGYDFGRGWTLGAEIEFEHGGTESAVEKEYDEAGEYESEVERGGEVALEQFWIQKSFAEWANIRAGHIIIPFGRTNPHHEPTEFFGVYRPEGEAKIFPCTWHETGLSFWGKAGDWRYEAMVVAGLDADRFGNDEWIGSGSGSPYEYTLANTLAGAFRLDNYSVNGLRLSLSGYYGDSFSNTMTQVRSNKYDGVKGTVALGAFDFAYDAHNIIVRGNFDYGHLSDAGSISKYNKTLSNNSPSPRQSVGSSAIDAGIEAGYNIFGLIPSLNEKKEKFYIFGRYEYYDSMASVDESSVVRLDWCRRSVVECGINYMPLPCLVVKAQYAIGLMGSTTTTLGGTVDYNDEPSFSIGICYSGWFKR